nr:MalY/PatB family protein [Mammaliicoccus sp. Marseille-Q6498]
MIFDEEINRIGTHCTQWDYVQDRFGKKGLLPFTISDTDFALPNNVLESLNARLKHPVFGYTRWDHPEFKDAVKSWYYKRFQTKIQDEWIYYTPTVIYAISQLITLKSNEGNGIIIQTPAYDAFFKVIKENKRNVVENPLSYINNQYKIDFKDLEEKLAHQNNKILLLCSPHNPTGRVWSTEELNNIITLCKKYNVFIISDEIHMDIVRSEYQHQPILNYSTNDIALVTSGSKTFNFPGLVFAYVLLPSLQDGEQFLNKLKKKDGLSSPSILGMEATINAYKCEDWVDSLNQYLERNIKVVEDYIDEYLPDILLVKPESTYLLWLDISKLNMDMKQLQNKLIEKGNVAIMDGSEYGGNGNQFLRFNIGCPKSKVEEGLKRVYKSIYQNE